AFGPSPECSRFHTPPYSNAASGGTKGSPTGEEPSLGVKTASTLTVLLGARLARAGCRAVRDSTLVAWYRSLYAPRTGGAYDSHHRTAGVAGCTWRCGSVAARGTCAAVGDASDWAP